MEAVCEELQQLMETRGAVGLWLTPPRQQLPCWSAARVGISLCKSVTGGDSGLLLQNAALSQVLSLASPYVGIQVLFGARVQYVLFFWVMFCWPGGWQRSVRTWGGVFSACSSRRHP